MKTNKSAVSDDRGHGMDVWHTRVAHGGQIGGHRFEAPRTELRELGSLRRELAPRDAGSEVVDGVEGYVVHHLDRGEPTHHGS